MGESCGYEFLLTERPPSHDCPYSAHKVASRVGAEELGRVQQERGNRPSSGGGAAPGAAAAEGVEVVDIESGELQQSSSSVSRSAVDGGSSPLRQLFIRPPWNSVHHLHLHVLSEPLFSGLGPRGWGFATSWFHATPDEALAEIRRRESASANSRL